jgi:hypothetical protein
MREPLSAALLLNPKFAAPQSAAVNHFPSIRIN